MQVVDAWVEKRKRGKEGDRGTQMKLSKAHKKREGESGFEKWRERADEEVVVSVE